jgi:hypothetical protein
MRRGDTVADERLSDQVRRADRQALAPKRPAPPPFSPGTRCAPPSAPGAHPEPVLPLSIQLADFTCRGGPRDLHTVCAKQVEAVLATGKRALVTKRAHRGSGRVEDRGSRPEYELQDLIFDAWGGDRARRPALALQALALWPDCADACCSRRSLQAPVVGPPRGCDQFGGGKGGLAPAGCARCLCRSSRCRA